MKRTVTILTAALFVSALAMPAFAQSPEASPAAAPSMAAPEASPAMAASVAWWAHIGGFVFGALVALVARRAPAAPAAPIPAPAPAPTPAMVWRHPNGWRRFILVPRDPPQSRGPSSGATSRRIVR